MRYLIACFLLVSVLLSVFSCEPTEDIVITNPEANLQFSADTVLFDTVFVQTGSVTQRLWVYNFNKNAVNINEIKLGNPGNSSYKIIVDGQETSFTQNIKIRGNDSILVLVKVQINPGASNVPFLVNDSLVFKTGNFVQDVQLVAYGQNAYFYRGDQALPCNAVWKADKPHVLYGKVVVNKDCKLTIEKGARIYAHKGSSIYIDGSLLIEGTAKERVTFTGDRLERFYSDIPGQWGGIRFFTNSKNNILRYADIKNAEVAIWVGSPDKNSATYEVTLEQCTIQNMFSTGILSFTSDIQAINTLITNCGQHAVAGFGGGTYDFKYCTIANYTPDFKRETPSFAFTDRLQNNGQNVDYRIKVSMANSIIWAGKKGGKLTEEMLFLTQGSQPSEISFSNNILQTELYRNTLDNSNIFNQDPKFKSTPEMFRPKLPYNYMLDTLSIASGAAKPLSTVKTDLKNVLRDSSKPDIGAYERLLP